MIADKTMKEIVSLAVQIDSKKSELSDLEKKFQTLVDKASSRKKPGRKPGRKPKAKAVEPEASKKPTRTKVKIVKALRRNGETRLKDLEVACGLSNAGTLAALNSLMASGEVVRSGYGKYSLSK